MVQGFYGIVLMSLKLNEVKHILYFPVFPMFKFVDIICLYQYIRNTVGTIQKGCTFFFYTKKMSHFESINGNKNT